MYTTTTTIISAPAHTHTQPRLEIIIGFQLREGLTTIVCVCMDLLIGHRHQKREPLCYMRPLAGVRIPYL